MKPGTFRLDPPSSPKADLLAASHRQREKSPSFRGYHAAHEIRTGCIGRGHAGKTALFQAMADGPIGQYFPSGLHIDAGTPKDAAKMIREAEETRRRLEEGGLPPTLEATPISYYVYDGDEPCIAFHMREVIGQILTHTMPDSSEEQQMRYEEYLKTLLDTHVIWTVIPCPPPNPNARDRSRYANDLRITNAYLREALRQRTTEQLCTVAFVVSKIDTLFESKEEAHQRLSASLLMQALAPLVNTVKRSSRVTDAAIIPVTAFGFGNATERMIAPNEDPRAEAGINPFGDEPVWQLKHGTIMEPYNLSTLFLWSILTGLMNQEYLVDDADVQSDTVRLFDSLRNDFYEDDPWFIAVKGKFDDE